MNKKIHLSLSHMSGYEEKFIREAFETNWVTPLGPHVNGFENDLAKFLDQEVHVVALSSGTAALHLALIQMGVKSGDEVLCQSFTFAASANPVVYTGATPIFIDSEAETWNISPEFLEQAICDRIEKTGKKPKAIIPVHLYGMPAKMDEITALSMKYDIPIIEDAAEALGSEYKEQKCGTFGTFSVLSFNGNKMITTSGGGALVCKTSDAAKKTLFYATQARENRPYYYHEEIGYNYRLSNICAGIGRGQMFVLNDYISRRRKIHSIYTELLKDVPGIRVMSAPNENHNSNYWLTCITVNPELFGSTAEEIRINLESKNIETRPLWNPMHLQPIYKNNPFYGDGTSESLFKSGLCLPSGSQLNDEEIQTVVSEIIKIRHLK